MEVLGQFGHHLVAMWDQRRARKKELAYCLHYITTSPFPTPTSPPPGKLTFRRSLMANIPASVHTLLMSAPASTQGDSDRSQLTLSQVMASQLWHTLACWYSIVTPHHYAQCAGVQYCRLSVGGLLSNPHLWCWDRGGLITRSECLFPHSSWLHGS